MPAIDLAMILIRGLPVAVNTVYQCLHSETDGHRKDFGFGI